MYLCLALYTICLKNICSIHEQLLGRKDACFVKGYKEIPGIQATERFKATHLHILNVLQLP